MSIIQTIQDKGAKIMVVIIAVALLGFILTDYFQSRNRSRGGGSESVGRVNGTKIGFTSFNSAVTAEEKRLVDQGYPSDQATQMALNSAWDQEVNRIIMEDEFDKLGVEVSKKELGDILYGANAPQDLKNQFTDPKTGIYNAAQAKQQIDQILKKGSPEQKASFNNYINQLIIQRKYEKYMSLYSNGTNVPRWFVEKQNGDNSLMAKASLVKEVYSSIPDSTIKIDDKEIADYVSKHKDDFKQTESRSISYVMFSAAPSKADSVAALDKANQLKAELDTITNVTSLLDREAVNPALNYDGYKNAAALQLKDKDSIIRMPAGRVYGPFLQGNSYMLARLNSVKQIADSAKVRHILIATMQRDQQTGQFYPVRDTVSAYTLADSIRKAIAAGSNFDTLCAKFSDDPGSKDKGGVYDYNMVYPGQMVGPFNDFSLGNPVGTKGIVKTDFGYHYIEVLGQKGGQTGYKVTVVPVDIVVSNVTEDNASNEAAKFAGDCRDLKSFDANVDKLLKPKGINKAFASVGPNDAQIGPLGTSRALVKDIYKASLGEVLKPVKVGQNYIVAAVTEILKEGTMSVEKARPGAEAVLRNKKKADVLKQKCSGQTRHTGNRRCSMGRQTERLKRSTASGSPAAETWI
ncbi:MAG: SurA N-terminal domain-containing protein [Chitinophagaceae bacterium]